MAVKKVYSIKVEILKTKGLLYNTHMFREAIKSCIDVKSTDNFWVVE